MVVGRRAYRFSLLTVLVFTVSACAFGYVTRMTPPHLAPPTPEDLLVDGATYTQTLVVHNDPRIGESAAVMSALRTQNKLALAASESG